MTNTMLKTLILIEHDGQAVKPASLSAIELARQLEGGYGLLVLGSGVGAVVDALKAYGAACVLVADHPALAEPVADRYSRVLVAATRKTGARVVAGTASTFTKDILPRVAAMLDAPMISDVIGIERQGDTLAYRHPVQAGNVLATETLEAEVHVLTVRGSAFQCPAPNGTPSPVESLEVDPEELGDGMQVVSRAQSTSTRPDLGEARVVVSGGRPLKDKETFDALIGGLADALGGAVGATRAAVDGGMAPNDLQVGQTGKVVAPELYIGVGVSGAVQHVAGIKDSRVIVAINRDPDAPIFQTANYGLVGDLHEILPRLIEAVRS